MDSKSKDDEYLFPINFSVIKEHYKEQLSAAFRQIPESLLLIDPELKLNIEYILHPYKENLFLGLKVLHDNYE